LPVSKEESGLLHDDCSTRVGNRVKSRKKNNTAPTKERGTGPRPRQAKKKKKKVGHKQEHRELPPFAHIDFLKYLSSKMALGWAKSFTGGM